MKLDRTQIARRAILAIMLFLGVGLGVAISNLPADTGDLLSFSGNLIGAALTIGGAVYLFEHQRHQAREASRGVMKQLVQEVLDEISGIRDPEPIGDVEDYVPAILIMGHVDRLAERIAAVKHARVWFSPDTAGMARAFTEIESLSVDPEAMNEAIKPNLFYGGLPDLEKYLREVEARANLAMAQLDL